MRKVSGFAAVTIFLVLTDTLLVHWSVMCKNLCVLSRGWSASASWSRRTRLLQALREG